MKLPKLANSVLKDRVLALGAKGVQIGTRFITTDECDADIRYKEFHLNASSEDVEIAPSPVGMPGRVLHNPFVEKVLQDSPDIDRGCNYYSQARIRN
jgi:nitronate monooxygenase